MPCSCKHRACVRACVRRYTGDPDDRKALLQHGFEVRNRRKALLAQRQRLEHAISVKARKAEKAKMEAGLEKQRRCEVGWCVRPRLRACVLVLLVRGRVACT